MIQLFDVAPLERANGIYTCDIGEGKLFTSDDEKTYFEISTADNGEKIVEFAPEISDGPGAMEGTNEEADLIGSGTVDMLGSGNSQPALKKNATHDADEPVEQVDVRPFMPNEPRVFVVRGDGSGSEFMN